jgi:hypothetical protein
MSTGYVCMPRHLLGWLGQIENTKGVLAADDRDKNKLFVEENAASFVVFCFLTALTRVFRQVLVLIV